MTLDEQLADTIRPPKRCSCGEVYDMAAWATLRLVGIQEADEDLSLELRDCAACTSTIAIELPVRAPS